MKMCMYNPQMVQELLSTTQSTSTETETEYEMELNMTSKGELFVRIM